LPPYIWWARRDFNPGPPAPKAGDIKTMFPEEIISWKHPSQMLITMDAVADNLETIVTNKSILG